MTDTNPSTEETNSHDTPVRDWGMKMYLHEHTGNDSDTVVVIDKVCMYMYKSTKKCISNVLRTVHVLLHCILARK